MRFLGLSTEQINKLEYEVVSNTARLKLTRLLRDAVSADDTDIIIMRQNACVNIARNVLGLPLYSLEPDDWGDYLAAEHAWHAGEIEVLMRRPTTAQLVETVADLLEENWLPLGTVNRILREDSASFSFEREGSSDNLVVNVLAVEELEETDEPDRHPNVRVLVARMDRALKAGDYAEVLHSSASMFETLAKIIVTDESIQNQTLGSFFEKYKKQSRLPAAVLDYMLEVYKRRNSEPLAGHGSKAKPRISAQEAITLAQLTKSFVKIERQLAQEKVTLERTSNPGTKTTKKK